MKVLTTRNTLTNIMHDVKQIYHASQRVKAAPLKTIIVQAPGYYNNLVAFHKLCWYSQSFASASYKHYLSLGALSKDRPSHFSEPFMSYCTPPCLVS